MKDKLFHAAAGGGISFIGCVVFEPFVGVLLASIAGGLKEWYDLKHEGTTDHLDAVATIVGGLVPAVFFGVLS